MLEDDRETIVQTKFGDLSGGGGGQTPKIKLFNCSA